MNTGQSAESPLHMAKTLLQKGRVSDAIAIITRFNEANPGNRDGLELLGMSCFMSKDYEQARDAFMALTRADPMYAAGWVNLGAVQNVLKDYQGATKALRKAIQRDKRSASAYYNLGIAQKAMKMNSMAISAYREAIKLQPKMAESYTNLGNIHLDMKNPTQAIRILEEGLQKCPDSKKIEAILIKAKSIKEGNRRNEAPLGRLVNEEELAQKQIRTSKRDLTAEERTTERENLRTLSKEIRELTRTTDVLLMNGLYKQLHSLHMAIVQQDLRGDGISAFERMDETLNQIESNRRATAHAIGQIRTNLERTDPGL